MNVRYTWVTMRFALAFLFCIFGAHTASAASLYMDPNAATLNRGDAVKIAIRLDTDEAAGECINAIDGVITYDDSITPVDISVGRSILPIWVQAPIINKAAHTITFAGGIPNGYCGRVQGDPNLTNVIAELVFRAPGMQVGGGNARNSAKIAFGDGTTAYLNDGLGTKARLQTYGAELTLNDGIGPEIVDPWSGEVADDLIAPEPFSISLERGEKNTFNGQYYIVFNTTDKQTGLSHYEVIEETQADSNLFKFGAANSPWVQAVSPYTIKDQSLHSVIRVKAIDKAGNEYIATLEPDDSMQTSRIPWMLIVVVGVSALALVLLLGLLLWLVIQKRAKKLATVQLDKTIIK